MTVFDMQAIHEMHKILGQVDILVSAVPTLCLHAPSIDGATVLGAQWTSENSLNADAACSALQGSPIVLANSLLAGGRAFLAEPAKARTPKAFARGVASGIANGTHCTPWSCLP